MNNSRTRVVVTGMGAMTPLGQTVDEYWSGLVQGKSGIGPITLADTTGGANHYCNVKVNPYWSFKTITRNGKKIKVLIKPVKTIGNHKFYKL